MSLNTTPSANRTHIGIFGRRNAGKSSLVNALTGQSLAIVSDVKGTTTDPVQKAMELLPLGPVVMIDTPGLDDDGELGALRVQKTRQVLNKTDIALLVVDACEGMTTEDDGILRLIREKKIPYVIVFNKADLLPQASGGKGGRPFEKAPSADMVHGNNLLVDENCILASAATGENIQELKERIARLVPEEMNERHVVRDLAHPLDFVVLVVPIDSAAPKGRLILPQQQVIRDLLEAGAVSVVAKETELAGILQKLAQKPSLVITDSQVFEEVAKIVPVDVPLTSFSILFARYKGNLETVVQGAKVLDALNDGDQILIC